MVSLLQSRFPLGANEFRILLVDGDHSDAPLRARIGVFPLGSEQCPQYIALSYVWGERKSGEKLEIQGLGDIDITDNLAAALRRIRPPKGHGSLYWVDQICIDQENNAEKNAQIPLMQKIYSTAFKVYIWLGQPLAEENDQVENALTVISKIANMGPNSIMPMIPLSLMKTEEATWACIRSFFKLPWFERAWTFQEAIVARAATVIYGENALDWSTLVDSIEVMNHQYLKWVSSLAQPTKLIAFARAVKVYKMRGNLSLEPLMFTRRCCSATNPRDMVYAHLGLTDITSSEIPIKYEMPVEQVYALTTKTLIRRERNLDVLTAVYHGNRGPEMPSWSVDWRVQVEYNPIASMHVQDDLQDSAVKPMYAAGGEVMKMKESDDWKELILKGKRITRISKTFLPCLEWQDDGIPRECVNWFQWFEGLQDSGTGLSNTYPWQNEVYLDAFSRTLIADQDKYTSWTDHRAGPEFRSTLASIYCLPNHKGSLFSDFLSGTEWKGTIEKQAIKYANTVKRVCGNRTLFIGENGCIGLVPWEARVGDEVCILFGGEVPYVLRRNEAHFEYVGEAYCHGFMDGEVVKDESPELTFRLK